MMIRTKTILLSVILTGLIIFTFYFILIYEPVYEFKTLEKINHSKKGICYFDIDGTLTTAKGDRNEMMKECLDNDFAIGIVTASPRKVTDICNGDKAIDDWMPDLLCKQFQENNAKMYNSTTQLTGSDYFPINIINKNQGHIKAWQMKYGRDKFYPDILDKCIVLFDDQQHIIDGVKQYDKNLKVQCSGHNPLDKGTCSTLGHVLDVTTIKRKINKMKETGCI
jgi:hypothetical protein